MKLSPSCSACKISTENLQCKLEEFNGIKTSIALNYTIEIDKTIENASKLLKKSNIPNEARTKILQIIFTTKEILDEFKIRSGYGNSKIKW